MYYWLSQKGRWILALENTFHFYFIKTQHILGTPLLKMPKLILGEPAHGDHEIDLVVSVLSVPKVRSPMRRIPQNNFRNLRFFQIILENFMIFLGF